MTGFSIQVEDRGDLRHVTVLRGAEVVWASSFNIGWNPHSFRVIQGKGLNEWPYYLMYTVGDEQRGFGFRC